MADFEKKLGVEEGIGGFDEDFDDLEDLEDYTDGEESENPSDEDNDIDLDGDSEDELFGDFNDSDLTGDEPDESEDKQVETEDTFYNSEMDEAIGKDSSLNGEEALESSDIDDDLQRILSLPKEEREAEYEKLKQQALQGVISDEYDHITSDDNGGFEVESVDTVLKQQDSIGADHDGSILQNDLLMTDAFDDVNKDADFISDTGEIVVMDTSENGDNFRFQYINIENIAIVKRIRKNTTNVEDLVQSIKSTGLLEPLVVAPTATEGMYVLLAGFRRIMACARAGKKRIPCIVNIKANVPEIPVLEALYNHSKSYTIREIVDYIDYLEKQKGIMSASMIEYLLQLNSGDYTKLKDILNDNDDDIVSKLFDGIYTIEMAFKKLEQRRKKESAEEKDNKKAAKVYEDENESGAANIAGSGEETDDGEGLSEEEIKSLAISAGDIDDVENEDLQDLIDEGNNIEGFQPHKQDYRDRERLDPALRKAVLARDENTCQICKIASGQEFIDVLDVHHIIEVYLGGDDNIDNLITACTVCHKLVHKYGRGELFIRPIEEFNDTEKERFKRIIKLGTIIRKGMAAKGMKKEQLKKLDGAETIGRTKPGTGQQAT